MKNKVIFPYQRTTNVDDEIWLAVAQQGDFSSWSEYRLVTSLTSLKGASVVLRPDGNGWISYYQLTSPLPSDPNKTGYVRKVYLVLSETKWIVNSSATIIDEEVEVSSLSTDEPPQMFVAYNRQNDKMFLGTFANPFDTSGTDVDKLRSVDRSRAVTDIDIGESLGGESAGFPVYTASAGGFSHVLYTTGTREDYVAQHMIIDATSDTAEVLTGPYGGGNVRWVACSPDRDGNIHAIIWPPGSSEEVRGTDFEHWIHDGAGWNLEFIFSEGY